LIATKRKTSDPDIELLFELLICFSWYMESKKVCFEGVKKQTVFEVLGKMLQHLGEKLNWDERALATIFIVFRKYLP
jgi:hypothetical protein